MYEIASRPHTRGFHFISFLLYSFPSLSIPFLSIPSAPFARSLTWSFRSNDLYSDFFLGKPCDISSCISCCRGPRRSRSEFTIAHVAVSFSALSLPVLGQASKLAALLVLLDFRSVYSWFDVDVLCKNFLSLGIFHHPPHLSILPSLGRTIVLYWGKKITEEKN